MATESLTKYNTITSLLDYERKNDITYNKLFLKSKIEKSDGNNLLVNSTSFANKYREYILQHTYDKTFTDAELIKYKYSPKLFCYEEYGTVELWGLLLSVNNMTSCTEFKKKTFKAFHDSIFDVINEILVTEEDRINKNNSDVGL